MWRVRSNRVRLLHLAPLRVFLSSASYSCTVMRVPHFLPEQRRAKGEEEYCITITHRAQDIEEWIQSHIFREDEEESASERVGEEEWSAQLQETKNNTLNNSLGSSINSSLCNTSKRKKKVVGLDIEWRPCSAKGQAPRRVALLQIATKRAALLVQLRPFFPSSASSLLSALRLPLASPARGSRRTLPPALLHLLGSEDCVKVGVGVLEDLRKLQEDFNTPIGAFLDIGLACRRKWTLHKFGLASLFELCYNQTLQKSKRISRSNWEAHRLSYGQIYYAAQDAMASLHIYHHLEQSGLFGDSYLEQASLAVIERLKGGSRAHYRQAVQLAMESDELFACIQHYIRQVEDVEDLLDHNEAYVYTKALLVYCHRCNSMLELASPQRRQILIRISGYTVKRYSVSRQDGLLTRQQIKTISNDLCKDVLYDLIQLQRTCIESESLELVGIFSNTVMHKLPSQQVQPPRSQSRDHHHVRGDGGVSTVGGVLLDPALVGNESRVELGLMESCPSYLHQYCRERSGELDGPGSL